MLFGAQCRLSDDILKHAALMCKVRDAPNGRKIAYFVALMGEMKRLAALGPGGSAELEALKSVTREALRAFRDKHQAAKALNAVLEDKMACEQLYLQQKDAITGQRAKVACARKAFLEKAAHSSFLSESEMEKASMDNKLAVLQVMESIIKDHESTMPNTQEVTQIYAATS
ncbi:hypothetical protein HDU80_009799, partial [Chytriomyces hyalinus]